MGRLVSRVRRTAGVCALAVLAVLGAALEATHEAATAVQERLR